MGEMDIEKDVHQNDTEKSRSIDTNRDDKLCCGGLGTGWVLFVLGFFLGALPWYIGGLILLFTQNEKEKPGYMACAIAAAISTIIVIISTITKTIMA